MQCTRFPVLVHILVALSVLKDEHISSASLAKSVSTNPAVIRKQIAMLVAAGWVDTLAGSRGGSMLIVDPEKITLRDVYKLLEQESVTAMHSPQMKCPIAVTVKKWVQKAVGQASFALEESLSETTIAEIAKDAEGDFKDFVAKHGRMM